VLGGSALRLRFRTHRIDLLDPAALRSRAIAFAPESLLADRDEIAAARLGRLKARQRNVAASNRMVGCTDAANGVVPNPSPTTPRSTSGTRSWSVA